jgi:hypothetical protein
VSKTGFFHGACLAACAAAPAFGQVGSCIIFVDKQEFESFNLRHRAVLKGIEDFEESNIPDGYKQVLPAPLQGNQPNVNPKSGFGFPNGLTQKNIIVQDNVFAGPHPPTVAPSGSPLALYVIGPGFLGSNSRKIGEDLEILTGQSASTDLIFTEPNHTGVGIELSHFAGFGNGAWQITAYNKNDDQICTFIVPDPGIGEPSKVFAGVWAPETIGRINIWDEGIIPDAIDNIQLWEEPAPVCPWDCAAPDDNTVDIADFLALLGTWGLPGPCDFDGDGAVDILDFLKLLIAWGPCPTPAKVRAVS